MSLGLNDLKKRPAATTNKSKSAKPTQEGAGAVSENWARSTRTARPWTTEGLGKGPKGRKPRPEMGEAFMSSEWVTDHSTLHAFEMEAQSALSQLRDLQISLKEQAVELERKIKRAAKSPFRIAKSVLKMVQK